MNVEVINEKENGNNDGVVSDDPNSIDPGNGTPDGNNNQAESGNDADNNDESNQDLSTSTNLVKNIAEGPKSSDPSHLNPLRSRVYFAANDGNHGNELWSSKGNGKSSKGKRSKGKGTRSKGKGKSKKNGGKGKGWTWWPQGKAKGKRGGKNSKR